MSIYKQFTSEGAGIVEKTATMPDGTEGKVYFRKCAHVDFERWRHAEDSDNPAEVERGKQRFIAACLVEPDGMEVFTDEDSIGLTSEGVATLFPLALEASGLVKRPDPKNDSGGEASST